MQEEVKELRALETASENKTVVPAKPRQEKKPKLSFKEKRELEELTVKVEKLEAEKVELEAAMSSGTMDVAAITAAGKRMEDIISEIDESEFRILELMEKEG